MNFAADMPYWTAVGFGMIHAGLLLAIFFRLGSLHQQSLDHDRRLRRLED